MVHWLGHEFTEYWPSTNWNELPGLYIFVRAGAAGAPDVPLYVGQTESFASRLPSHPLWGHARQRYEANRIDARVVQDEVRRGEVEAYLIHGLQPPMNKLLR